MWGDMTGDVERDKATVRMTIQAAGKFGRDLGSGLVGIEGNPQFRSRAVYTEVRGRINQKFKVRKRDDFLIDVAHLSAVNEVNRRLLGVEGIQHTNVDVCALEWNPVVSGSDVYRPEYARDIFWDYLHFFGIRSGVPKAPSSLFFDLETTTHVFKIVVDRKKLSLQQLLSFQIAASIDGRLPVVFSVRGFSAKALSFASSVSMAVFLFDQRRHQILPLNLVADGLLVSSHNNFRSEK